MLMLADDELLAAGRELSRRMRNVGTGGCNLVAPALSGLGSGEGGGSLHAWAPAVDISENDSEITISAELPGMKKEEIDIELNGDKLVIRGQRRRAATRPGENYQRIERQYGPFLRTFQIEAVIDAPHISAGYEAGVLVVRLPKQGRINSRSIPIGIAGCR
jgi:HSP20 family protein